MVQVAMGCSSCLQDAAVGEEGGAHLAGRRFLGASPISTCSIHVHVVQVASDLGGLDMPHATHELIVRGVARHALV